MCSQVKLCLSALGTQMDPENLIIKRKNFFTKHYSSKYDTHHNTKLYICELLYTNNLEVTCYRGWAVCYRVILLWSHHAL